MSSSFLRLLSLVAKEPKKYKRSTRSVWEHQQKINQKWRRIEKNRENVKENENNIESLTTLHLYCSNTINWRKIYNTSPPPKPKLIYTQTKTAIQKYKNYKPFFLSELLGFAKRKKNKLKANIINAKQVDINNYKSNLKKYKKWLYKHKLSKNILNGNLKAYQIIIKKTNSFDDLYIERDSINFKFINAHCVVIDIKLCNEDIVPKENLKILKSGKLSIKKMPKAKFYKIYKDYVCSFTLRIAREIFALLPIKMIIVNAFNELLDIQTDYKKNQTILSVAIPRSIVQELNIKMINPSDSIEILEHNMNFRKTKGFKTTNKIDSKQINYLLNYYNNWS